MDISTRLQHLATSIRQTSQRDYDSVLEYLTESGQEMTASEIAVNMGMPLDIIQNALYHLTRQKKVRKRGFGNYTVRHASTHTATGLSDETRAIAKKALRLTDEYHRELQALVKRAQTECESLETECDEKQPERFSDAEEAQWWVQLQSRKERSTDLCKLLKDIVHEDLSPSVSAKGSLGQFMKD